MNATPLSQILYAKIAAAEIAAQNAPFVVTFSGTTADSDAACDKKFDEIHSAFAAGKNVKFVYNKTDRGTTYDLAAAVYGTSYSGSYTELEPQGTEIGSGLFIFCQIFDGDVVTCTFDEI